MVASRAIDHEKYMRMTIAVAREGEKGGNPPVGSLVVLDSKVIAKAYNTAIPDLDVCAHAETVALKRAGQALGHLDMTGSTLYSTGESCMICAGAIAIAGVKRVVLGGNYHKSVGKVGDYSLEKALALVGRNDIEVIRGVLTEECEAMRWAYWSRTAKKQP
ncbi:MAG: nucleoside deaminase [SAR202 cluster bacterium]|nr:nucleoside deaminase [SAR202 cluster bacterium]